MIFESPDILLSIQEAFLIRNRVFTKFKYPVASGDKPANPEHGYTSGSVPGFIDSGRWPTDASRHAIKNYPTSINEALGI